MSVSVSKEFPYSFAECGTQANFKNAKFFQSVLIETVLNVRLKSTNSIQCRSCHLQNKSEDREGRKQRWHSFSWILMLNDEGVADRDIFLNLLKNQFFIFG